MRYLVPLLMLLPLYPVQAQDKPPPPPTNDIQEQPNWRTSEVKKLVEYRENNRLVAKVDGPPSGRVGDLLTFSADVEASDYKWILLPDGLGKLITFPDGKKAVFATHDPGEYMIILAVANQSGRVDLAYHPIMIGQSLLDPTQPQVQTQATEAQVTYLELAAQLASQLPKDQRLKVATVIRQVQGLIEPGNVESYQELKELTSDLTRKQLGNNNGVWVEFLNRVYQTLPNMEVRQAGSVWLEIARGLEQ